jgi:SAM-dependent methyltransferase
MIDISDENLTGKTVLEVGCGRGGTTRELVRLLSEHPGSRLIATDLSAEHFDHLKREFGCALDTFIQTCASELTGLGPDSVDLIVCSYTLCAVNSRAWLAGLALKRFWSVLKTGGTLYIAEEYPIDLADGPAQEVWAEKWSILKAIGLLCGNNPYTEFEPEILAGLCEMAGFMEVEWSAETEFFQEPGAMSFFQARLAGNLPALSNDRLRAGFREQAESLAGKAAKAGGMEAPYYRLKARKPC